MRRFHYDRMVLAGHSLGSLVASDTLNALSQRDLANNPAMAVGVIGRTGALI